MSPDHQTDTHVGVHRTIDKRLFERRRNELLSRALVLESKPSTQSFYDTVEAAFALLREVHFSSARIKGLQRQRVSPMGDLLSQLHHRVNLFKEEESSLMGDKPIGISENFWMKVADALADLFEVIEAICEHPPQELGDLTLVKRRLNEAFAQMQETHPPPSPRSP